MKVFIDTSALYALVVENDKAHEAAQRIRAGLEMVAEQALTTNYVLLETVSLLQKRQGYALAERVGDLVIEQVEILWVDAAQHREAWRLWKHEHLRGLSLVDCASFVVMRESGIRRAFAFDEHFRRAGFELLMPPSDRVAEKRGVYRAGRLHRKHA